MLTSASIILAIFLQNKTLYFLYLVNFHFYDSFE